MKLFNKYFTVGLIVFLGYSHGLFSQNNTISFSNNDKLSIIKKAMQLLQENYIFPEKVEKIEKGILQKFTDNKYDAFDSPQDFLSAINNDLEELSNDTHINISYNPDRVQQILKEQENEGKEPVISKEWLQKLKHENFRLRKVEWLEGNIGYFKFLNFTELEPSKESIVGAMNFIRNSNAIIIDLTDNGGGSSETLEFMLSYFLKDGLKIGEYRFRKNNRIEEVIINKDPLVNKISADIPLYILVSKKTSSAAEGMASVLQSFRGAVIVGENTKGEGNPGELFVLNDQLYIMVPTAISISTAPNAKPVEGVGVTPDVKINPIKALDKALLGICKTLAKNISAKVLQHSYEWQIPLLEYKVEPKDIPLELMNAFKGNYQDGRKIIMENGQPFYINMDNQKSHLEYYGNNVFGIEGKQFVRIRIPIDENPINSFEFFWDDGYVEVINRVIQ